MHHWLKTCKSPISVFSSGGRLLVFVRFRPPARAAAPRMDTASHPCHVTLISTKPLFQFIWCSTYWIQVLIPRLHQLFRKLGKIFGSLQPSLTFFVKLGPVHPDIYQTAFSILLCSTHWMQILIPRLHQFFRKFVKIFGSWRPSLIFFRQIWTLSP